MVLQVPFTVIHQ